MKIRRLLQNKLLQVLVVWAMLVKLTIDGTVGGQRLDMRKRSFLSGNGVHGAGRQSRKGVQPQPMR